MMKNLKWNLILMSLLYLALGLFLLAVPGVALNIVCYALGGVVLACAAVQLIRYFTFERLELRRCGYPSWKWFILLALLSVVLGAIMIFVPFGAMETLVMGIGIILLIEGAFNLGGAIYTALAVRRFNKLHPDAQSVLEAATGLDLNGDGVIGAPRTSADVEATARELDTVDESAEVHQE